MFFFSNKYQCLSEQINTPSIPSILPCFIVSAFKQYHDVSPRWDQCISSVSNTPPIVFFCSQAGHSQVMVWHVKRECLPVWIPFNSVGFLCFSATKGIFTHGYLGYFSRDNDYKEQEAISHQLGRCCKSRAVVWSQEVRVDAQKKTCWSNVSF